MSIGGKARSRSQRVAPTRATKRDGDNRKRAASVGSRARARSLEIERRIAANFKYAAAVARLRGPSPPVVRMRAFAGPLPGIYYTDR